jgi:uncharacterized coiled-coil DUF342 family protein
MKLGIQLICAAIIGAILMFVIYEPNCEQAGPSQQDYDAMKGVYENVVAENLELIRFSDSLQWEAKRYDTTAKQLRREIIGYQARIKDSSAKIKALAIQVKELSSGADKDSLCNDLANQVLSLLDQYHEISERYDYLTRYIDSSSMAYQGAIDQLKKANDNFHASYDKLYNQYLSLLTDTNELQKSLRRQKLKTKIAAVLGIIGTGAALFK